MEEFSKMMTKLRVLCIVSLFVACCLSSLSCGTRISLNNPLGNVTLTAPYAVQYPGARTDKISVQYAVIAIAGQVGLGYDWDTSFKNTDPVCREWITPEIRRQTFPQALEMILHPVNLTYTIANGKVILGRRL